MAKKAAGTGTPPGFKPCSSGSQTRNRHNTLSIDEVAAVVLTAGFDPNNDVTIGAVKASSAKWAVATIMKESHGFICARNHNTNGSIDRGIAQWNDRAHPEISDDCAFTPNCAVQKMLPYANNFSPWYYGVTKPIAITRAVGYFPQAQAAIDKSHATGLESGAKKAGDVIGGVAGALTGLVNLLGALFKGSTWIRGAEIIGGMVLIATGIWMISRDLGLSGVEEQARKFSAPTVGKTLGSAGKKVLGSGNYTQLNRGG